MCHGPERHTSSRSLWATDDVAEVLAEFMGGAATRFTPNPGSWFAHQHDEYGTGVEVYPAGTELRPAGPEGAGFAMTEPIRPGYSPTHFALSVPISREQITAIAEREGWQCHCCERGTGGFHVRKSGSRIPAWSSYYRRPSPPNI